MDNYRNLHRLFRKLQQRNRSVGTLHGTGLLLVESHFLTELDAEPGRGAAELTEILGLDRSSVTRLIGRLQKRGLLQQRQSGSDRRRKVLAITRRGRAAVRRIDAAADHLLEQFCAPLGADERERLRRYLAELGDGFGHPPGRARTGEHPLRLQQRRLAQYLGMVRTSFHSSGVATSHWQVLGELAEDNLPLTPAILSKRLGIAPNVLTTITRTLVARGYVKASPSPRDMRSLFLTITPSGNALFQRLEAEGAAGIKRAAAHFSASQISEFLTLMEKLTGTDRQELPSGFCLEQPGSAQAITSARMFFLQESVRAETHAFAPANLCGAGTSVYVLRENEEIKALLQVLHAPRLNRISAHAATPSLPKRVHDAFIRSALAHAAQIDRKPLALDFPPLAGAIASLSRKYPEDLASVTNAGHAVP